MWKLQFIVRKLIFFNKFDNHKTSRKKITCKNRFLIMKYHFIKINLNMKSEKLFHAGLGSLLLLPSPGLNQQLQAQEKKKLNVLFIAVDDLKPITAAYGDKIIKTPGIDRIAREGMVFMNTYCQQAVSGPTRASLMTGLMPDKTRVWDLVTDFRKVNPNIVTMPEYFRKMGYETTAVGKIYHNGAGATGPGHDAPSWSIPWRNSNPPTYANSKEKPATESAEVADDFYKDGQTANIAIELMNILNKGDKPFFLSVGFIRPHLPFVAPKKYWDLYNRNEFNIAPYQKASLNGPQIAYHASGELTGQYTDIPKFDSYSDSELDHLPVEKQKELIHGYYAATSYMDAQLQRVLNELDRLGIRNNTIVVFWGDHGWHLGDHGLWCKHTNFEQATHTIMMISVPGMKTGIKPTSVSEFVDIFPTLCELTNIPIPANLDGVSLVPAMKNPAAEVKKYARSQYPRGKAMGYAIRTNRYRYVEWLDNNFRTYMQYDSAKVVAKELYDYRKDPLETENVADNKKYVKVKEEMAALFADCMRKQYNSSRVYSQTANYQDAKTTVK
jgi:iduronate 2-sulfatase